MATPVGPGTGSNVPPQPPANAAPQPDRLMAVGDDVKRLILSHLGGEDLKKLDLNHAWKRLMSEPLIWELISKKLNIPISIPKDPTAKKNPKEDVIKWFAYQAYQERIQEALKCLPQDAVKNFPAANTPDEINAQITAYIHGLDWSARRALDLRFRDFLGSIAIARYQATGLDQTKGEDVAAVKVEAALQLIKDGILDDYKYLRCGDACLDASIGEAVPGLNSPANHLPGNKRIFEATLNALLAEYARLDEALNAEGKPLDLMKQPDPRAILLFSFSRTLSHLLYVGAPKREFVEFMLKAGVRPVIAYDKKEWFYLAIESALNGSDPEASNLKLLLQYLPSVDNVSLTNQVPADNNAALMAQVDSIVEDVKKSGDMEKGTNIPDQLAKVKALLADQPKSAVANEANQKKAG